MESIVSFNDYFISPNNLANHHISKDLLEPSLLPSLVISLTCFGDYVWKASIHMVHLMLRIMDFLINPPSISDESRQLHRTVLCIVSRHLIDALSSIPGRPISPEDQAIFQQIMSTLEAHLWFQRSVKSPPRHEFETWVDHALPIASDGTVFGIRKTFSGLLNFSAETSTDMAPVNFTYRQIVHAIQTAGAPRVLGGILDEVELYSGSQSAGTAADLAVSLITAYVPETFARDHSVVSHLQSQQRLQNSPSAFAPAKVAESSSSTPRSLLLTLQDALILEHQSLSKPKTEANPTRSEIIVRLYRRVNALTALSPHIPLTLSDPSSSQDSQSHSDNMGQISTNMIPDIALDDAKNGTNNNNNNDNHVNDNDNIMNSTGNPAPISSATDPNFSPFNMDGNTNFDDLMEDLPTDTGILDDIDNMF